MEVESPELKFILAAVLTIAQCIGPRRLWLLRELLLLRRHLLIGLELLISLHLLAHCWVKLCGRKLVGIELVPHCWIHSSHPWIHLWIVTLIEATLHSVCIHVRLLTRHTHVRTHSIGLHLTIVVE